MTREEAISKVRGYLTDYLPSDNYEEVEEIVKALEQEPKKDIKLTNSEWVDFLSKQFDISRTSAKEMLHVMMSVKKEDNFKKQFSGRK